MKKELAKFSVLHKKDFDKFINALLQRYNIFGPSKSDMGEKLNKINAADDLLLDYRNFRMSAKGFFLPQCETMFTFDTGTGAVNEQTGDNDGKENIIFGIRPCDTMAISFLDQVFMNTNPEDSYYADKRRKTVIFSLACLEPEPTCFCSAVGCNVDSESGADIMISQVNSRYLINPINDKGIETLKITKTLTPATEDDIKEQDQVIAQARGKLKVNLAIKDLKKKLDVFDASYWQVLHQKCLGCGVCTYFCPTCHCFDMTDDLFNNTGRRIRTWDSCMFPLFTLHASGHNPRSTQKERMRQRILHKFCYAQDNYQKTFCVGCGRCIVNCPVNLDIRNVLQEILEAK